MYRRQGRKRRLTELEERHALTRDELRALREQLGRLRCDAYPHAAAMRLVAQPEKLRRVEVKEEMLPFKLRKGTTTVPLG